MLCTLCVLLCIHYDCFYICKDLTEGEINQSINQSINTYIYLPMKMKQTDCPEMSAYKLQMPGNYPEESIQHSEHSKSLKSRR